MNNIKKLHPDGKRTLNNGFMRSSGVYSLGAYRLRARMHYTQYTHTYTRRCIAYIHACHAYMH